MEGSAKQLQEMLRLRREKVAQYERRRAMVFDPQIDLLLEDERAEIVRIKIQLKKIGVDVDNDPFDEELSSEDDEEEPDQFIYRKQQLRRSKTPPQLNISIGWIIVLFIFIITFATWASLTLSDIFLTAVVLIFTLIALGIILPILALFNNQLSTAVWLRSYIAVLKKIPLLESIIERTPKK